MPKPRILCIEKVDLNPKTKADAQESMALLETNAKDIELWVGETEDADLDEEHLKEEAEDDDHEDEKDDEDDPKAEETAEGKVARHKEKWQKKKSKYQKYAGKGKVDKLQRAMARQEAKLQKAIDNGKPEVYIEYKKAKVDFTKNMIKTAELVANLKKSGLMR